MQEVAQDLSDDENFAQDGEKELTKQLFKSGYSWKGIPLKPYSAATDWLFDQLFDEADAAYTIFLKFIFLHTLEEENAIDLCWDRPRFRRAMLKWIKQIGPLSNEDKAAAMDLFEEIRGWARKSSVEVIPDPSLPQKKTEATSQPRSPV
jgi:hypothetical protein